MRKMGSYFFEENEFSSNVFFGGMTVITVVLWFLLKKFILGYYFWQDEICDGVILHYIYIGIGALNAWFVSEWCRNKSLFRMVTAGLTPVATVMSLRWFFSGFVTAKILLMFMSAYIVCMLFQIIKSVLKKKKTRIIVYFR